MPYLACYSKEKHGCMDTIIMLETTHPYKHTHIHLIIKST
jgi:hypothetical protein